MALGVLPARAPTAEPTGGERRPLADPAVHSRSPNGPAEAGPDIMARPRPEITHRFARSGDQCGEVRPAEDPDHERVLRRHGGGPRHPEDERQLPEPVARP